MRLALALLSAAGVWATACGQLPPCASLRPGLTVALAEVLEDHPASSSAPIRLKLRTLAYGPSPGAEFTYPAAESEEARTGDLYYIEGSIPFQRGPCGISGRLHAQLHRGRLEAFQRFAAGQPKTAAFAATVQAVDGHPLPGALVTLSGEQPQLADGEGRVRWERLAPGSYTLTATSPGLILEESLPTVNLVSGACASEWIRLVPPHSIRGIVQGPGGRPAADVPIQVRATGDDEVLDSIRSSSAGEFTISQLGPGFYTITAGNQPRAHSPFPARSISVTVPGPDIVIPLAEPAPSRTVTLSVNGLDAADAVPIITGGPATIYSRRWDATRKIITLTLSANQPFQGRVLTIPLRWKPADFEIPEGTEDASLTVQLQKRDR